MPKNYNRGYNYFENIVLILVVNFGHTEYEKSADEHLNYQLFIAKSLVLLRPFVIPLHA